MQLFLFSEMEVSRPRQTKWAGGYASVPGTYGNASIKCKHCRNYTLVEWKTTVHRKCAKIKVAWTHGAGTDIKANAPACKAFEALK